MANTDGQPRLFLYSLLVPFLWLSFGTVMDYLAPEKRLGVAGLVVILVLATVGMSWLLVRKYKRQFTNQEIWRLIAYCFTWVFLAESAALFYVMSYPEELGFAVDVRAAKISLVFTAVLDFVFVWLALKQWSPRFINWYLEKGRDDVT